MDSWYQSPRINISVHNERCLAADIRAISPVDHVNKFRVYKASMDSKFWLMIEKYPRDINAWIAMQAILYVVRSLEYDLQQIIHTLLRIRLNVIWKPNCSALCT